jgi:hypothetical protein
MEVSVLEYFFYEIDFFQICMRGFYNKVFSSFDRLGFLQFKGLNINFYFVVLYYFLCLKNKLFFCLYNNTRNLWPVVKPA